MDSSAKPTHATEGVTRIPLLVLFALAGILIGSGSYTFFFAEGLSYLGNDPATCAHCHIMREQYEGWQKGPHHGVSTCNDCHVPNGLAGKYWTKAMNGYHHSRAFTFQDFHEPIQIKESNAEVLQANCLRCHDELTSCLVRYKEKDFSGLKCVRCHADAGHGPRR